MSQPAAPADQASRLRFARETGLNFAVCAGAGTGKTTAISARIARLVLEDARDEGDAAARLVVVTYTKAAAAELRARALAASLAAVQDPAAAGHADLSRPSAARAQRALAGLQRAFFGTIHAYCLQLLAQHGSETGLTPEHDLRSEAQLRPLVERFRQEAAESVAVPAELLRYIRYEDLVSDELLERPADLPPPPVGPAPRPQFQRLYAFPEKGVGAANARRTKESAQRWEKALEEGRIYIGLPELHGKAKALEELHTSLLAPLQSWIDATSAQVRRDLVEGFAEYRLREGALVFDDLIRLTLELLQNPEVLQSVRAERRLVLLDEAQDTSREMFEILAEITRPPGAAWGAWPAHAADPPRPGGFSMVGDDQQSVYRDKARPEDFAEYAAAIARDGGAQLDLHVTMRCDEAVVALVNALFADEKVAIAAGGEAGFRPLTARAGAGPGCTWRLPIPYPEQRDFLGTTRRAEAEGVAQWLAAQGPGGLGVESWGDIAIIAPRKAWLEPVDTALRRLGIPVRSRAAVRIARTQPAWSWPIALLHVLAEPWDLFELLGLLRDVFGIADPELLRAHRRGALRIHRPPVDRELPPALFAALADLHELHRISLAPGTTGVGLLDAISARLRLPGRLETVHARTDALAVLREKAALVCHTGEPWRNWARDQVAELEQQPPELPPLSDGVELIGAQKAKGLQWKVVIALGLGQGIAELGGTPEEERPGRDAELRRFLYVTLTRARRTIIIPETLQGFHPEPKEGAPSYAGLLPHLTSAVAALPVAPAGEGEPWPEPPPTQAPKIDWKAAALASRPPARRLRPVDAAASRVAIDLTEDEREPLGDDPLPTADSVQPLLEAAGGRHYGTWWHEALARFPWRAGRAAQNAWQQRELEQLLEEELHQRGRAELARLFASAELFRMTGAAAQCVAEVPLVYAFRGAVPRWMEGVADFLLLDGRGGAIVIDWKTDSPLDREPPAAFAARLKGLHQKQLGWYAAALRDGAGLRLERAFLYATASGELIECEDPVAAPAPAAEASSYQQLELF